MAAPWLRPRRGSNPSGWSSRPSPLRTRTTWSSRTSWTPYFETYKKLTRNYCNAHSFRKKRLKEAEDNQRATDAEARLKEKATEAEGRLKENLAIKELKLNNNIALKRLDLKQSISGAASSGASTPISREFPVPQVVSQLSKQDISQFKPTNSFSSELSFLKMQDWKEDVLNWFKIANHTNLNISMQKHLLKIVVDPDMWVKACYTFEAQDSHINMIDKLYSQFEV